MKIYRFKPLKGRGRGWVKLFYYDEIAKKVKYLAYEHRYIYEKCVGPIPLGWDIHHIDGDRSNNIITNLLCVSKGEHREIHRQMKKNKQIK